MTSSKSYDIPKSLFVDAFKRVKASKGAPGVDGQSIKMFEGKLEDNLYKLWNRMSSGSYFPQAVRLCEIPKSDGGTRVLGIPTVTDRIAQMVVKQVLEPRVETIFHEDSYAYRPGKSAIDAVGQTRKRCWKMDWVVDIDIKGFFDNINHGLMLKALALHAEESWIHLYVKRWLTAPAVAEDGEQYVRDIGTPQGGVISPLLANLFLHYTLDVWLSEYFSDLPFERYADDVIIHCVTEKQANYVLSRIRKRLVECGLMLNEKKTRIVYCKDSNRKGKSKQKKFDFLGFEFRPRQTRNSLDGHFFVAFTPAVSPKALKAIQKKIRSWKLSKRSPMSLEEIAQAINPIVRGWLNYYGSFSPSSLGIIKRYIDHKIVAWAMRKFKLLHRRFVRTIKWLKEKRSEDQQLFAHWA